MAKIIDIRTQAPVMGLHPQQIPAELIARPTHLQCGKCGFSDTVEFYVPTDETECYQPVCNCPIEATLEA